MPRINGAGQEYDPSSTLYRYVDEAQDNLIVDMLCEMFHSVCARSGYFSPYILAAYLVLRALCRNPNGLFWAGDTAQTIAVGSSFTFNELKSMMYRVEVGSCAWVDLPFALIQTFFSEGASKDSEEHPVPVKYA